MYAENEPAMGRNDTVLNDLPGELYTIEAHSKITDNCKHPLTTIKAVRNHKHTNTGGLAKLRKVKIGAKGMVTVNLEIQDGLINGQAGNNSHIEFAQGSTQKVYVKFSDEPAGLKPMRSSYLGRQNPWTPIEKCEEIPIKKESPSPSIKSTHIPLMLAWVDTIHAIQGLSLEQGATDFINIYSAQQDKNL